MPGDDEEFLSCIKPTQLGKANCFNGDALIAHFAFGPQREGLDKMDILNRYGKILHDLWKQDESMREIDISVQQMIKKVEACEAELNSLPSPYKCIPKVKVPFFMRLGKKLPEKVRCAIRELQRKQRYKFIER